MRNLQYEPRIPLVRGMYQLNRTKWKNNQTNERHRNIRDETTDDMQLIPIEKIFSNRDSIRKAREAFLIQKGRTIDPDGLNIREETY